MAPAQPSAERAENVDVSVLVPVLNEERHIRETVRAMQAQRFDGSIELLFADGGSEDRTREILLELAASDPRIRVLDNPRRRTASGLNVCLREARGTFVARMDAHTFYCDRYLAAGVARLSCGDTEWVSGPAVPRARGPVSRAVALALASRLGRGGSRKWQDAPESAGERDLDSGVFGGVWRRTTLLQMGGWDERWPINQDSELASRYLREGGRLVCLPEMTGHYVPRDSLRGLALQYYRYGFYRARTFRRHPEAMRSSHLAAPALVLAPALAVVSPTPLRRASRLALYGYFLAVLTTSTKAMSDGKDRLGGSVLLAVLPTMHIGWGLGTIVGAFRFGAPVAALARLAGLSSGTTSEESECVYAPSLREANQTADAGQGRRP